MYKCLFFFFSMFDLIINFSRKEYVFYAVVITFITEMIHTIVFWIRNTAFWTDCIVSALMHFIITGGSFAMIVGLYAWKIHKRIKKAEETIAKKHVLYVNGELNALHQFNTDSKSHAMNTIEEQLWRHATSASNLLDLNSERDLLKKRGNRRLRNPFESRTVKKMEKSILANIPHTLVVEEGGLEMEEGGVHTRSQSSSSVDEGTMKRGLAIAHKKRKNDDVPHCEILTPTQN